MSENDNAKTANEIGAEYSLLFETSEWLDKVSFIACEVEMAYQQGDCEFLAREGIADALESILCITADELANESQKCKADINYHSAFTGICGAFESCFCEWLDFAHIPEFAEMINGIRADIKARSMRDFSDVRLESSDDFCIMPYAFLCYYPWDKSLDVEDFRIIGTAGQANIRKLIAIGRAMARAAQARKGVERIETKHAERKVRRPVSIWKMAEYADVSKETIMNWEKGKGTPTCESGQYGVRYCAAIRNSELTARTFGEIYRSWHDKKSRVSLATAEREKKIAELSGHLSIYGVD